MRFNVEQNGSEIICTLSGRLNTEVATGLCNQVDELIVQAQGKHLVIDCSGLEYISSSGLRLFLKIKKQLDGVITIRNMKPDIKQILTLTKIDEFFEFED
ncbi:MAG: STAS domain-containing protein [Paludibacteraceae bacterium]|nr:STAS domain-containing protein [Paludibacteraceae bacterium]